jgi:hypothetical protein
MLLHRLSALPVLVRLRQKVLVQKKSILNCKVLGKQETFYCGERGRERFLEGSQASPTRPSGNSSTIFVSCGLGEEPSNFDF